MTKFRRGWQMTTVHRCHGRSGALRRLLIVLVVFAVAASACGIERDTEPRVLAREDLPADLRPGQLPTPVPDVPIGGETSDSQVFMIGPDDKLIGVFREVTEDPVELLDTLLLRTSPAEAAEGIYTTLSRETRVQNIEIFDLFRVATVELAPGSLDARNNEQKLGFAQIVFTLTSLPDIETVEFVQTDPENPNAGPVPIPVQTDTGTTVPGQRVGRDAFALLDPSIVPQPNFDPDIPTPVPTITPVPAPDPDNATPLFDIPIWKLNEQSQLVRVARQVERNQEALLFSLFDGTLVDERADLIRSAIPPDALFNGIETQTFEILTTDADGNETIVVANTALVDLAQGSLPPSDEGRERLLATAQIVYTLTELIEIDQVALSIEGVFIPMDIPAGLTAPFDPENPIGLTRADFISELEPGPTPAPIGAEIDSTDPFVAPTPTPGT